MAKKDPCGACQGTGKTVVRFRDEDGTWRTQEVTCGSCGGSGRA